MTKMFHPNVSKAGEICVDTLKKGWKKEYGVGHVLVVSASKSVPPIRLHFHSLLGRTEVEEGVEPSLTSRPLNVC